MTTLNKTRIERLYTEAQNELNADNEKIQQGLIHLGG